MGLLGVRRREVETRQVVVRDVTDVWSLRSAQLSVLPAVVEACVRLLAGTVATLPVQLLRDGEPVPLGWLARPSPPQPRPQTIAAMVRTLLLHGDLVAAVATRDDGSVLALDLVDPAQVGWRTEGTRARLTVQGRPVRLWPDGPWWHCALDPVAGHPAGTSRLAAARAAVEQLRCGDALVLDAVRAGGVPSGVVSSDHPLTEEQAGQIKAAFLAAVRGRVPAVLGSGLRYQATGGTVADLQLTELLRRAAEDVCRVFGVPPEMIGLASSGQSVTYANREQRAIDFVAFGVAPILAQLEAGLGGLLPPGERVRFRVAGLLRADLKARYDSYETAAKVAQLMGEPLLTVAEMRAFEDL